MASLLLKGVHKRLGLPTISISCSSAHATSVVASTSTTTSGSRIIDRHSPRLSDPHRTSTSTKPPRPSFRDRDIDNSASSPKSNQQLHGHGGKKKKKSSSAPAGTANGGRRSWEKRLVSPATSSRFLLNSSRMQSDDIAVDILALPPPPPPPPPPSFLNVFPGKDGPAPTWPVHYSEEKQSVMQLAESSSSGSSSASTPSEITPLPGDGGHDQEVLKRSSSTRTTQPDQVVVLLRVSLHCKGCAGKVKKHIAKMEGVTSFHIDIATKKVTVVGDVTPLGVLTSVSKVKQAQFWPEPSRSSCTPPRASASF